MVTENGGDNAIQVGDMRYSIQRRDTQLENEQFKRSFTSFLSTILSLYQDCNGRGKKILDISVDFDKVKLTHKEGSFDLPNGSTSVNLVSTNANGPTDLRIWNSAFIAREAENGQSVYGGKLGTYIAGQNTDGSWSLVSSFEELLDETPKERVMRIIHERWVSDGAESDDVKAQIAAEEVLTRTWINNPREFGDFTNETIEALFNAEVKNHVSPRDSLQAFMQLSEFRLAKTALTVFFSRSSEGIESAIQKAVLRGGTGCYAYDLDYNPIEQIKAERHFMKMIEISPTDIDRFGGNMSIPELDSGE
jgi:hypothetical protein